MFLSHNTFDLKHNVLFPRIEMRSCGDIVPLRKVNFIKVFSPDSGIQLVI